MINFVRPNFPVPAIIPAQDKLSTGQAFYNQMKGVVHWRTHATLRRELAVHDYTFMLRLSPSQRTLYNAFLEHLGVNKSEAQLLPAFTTGIKIWNHLDVLYKSIHQSEGQDQENGGTKKKKANDSHDGKRPQAKKRKLEPFSLNWAGDLMKGIFKASM